MSVSPPMVVKLTVSDLTVVSYPADDETLPESRSNVFQLTDPRLIAVDGATLKRRAASRIEQPCWTA